ncbi:hypothetical protein GCM10010399_78040 [Dactylosporangium fulvum]|uniref:Uncharacterized protein n=1 Tax=Dactylosporangium fulvum TaxID=53359 RepID=A0ABY5W8J0_9ACTN|nr:hypothetical protein [Dactylosporangium fulvum]UWP86192.1 hypothetical protein Dfulv_18890 [Dactylosporangium fulvum]
MTRTTGRPNPGNVPAPRAVRRALPPPVGHRGARRAPGDPGRYGTYSDVAAMAALTGAEQHDLEVAITGSAVPMD